MEAHEYANLFPMMTSEEMAQLCEDMRASGYDHSAPIVLYNGLILDGRNRQLAADTVGLTPVYITFGGNDQAALDFVIRHNLKRRHLNETQRAVVAGRLANMERGGDRPSANDLNFDHANLHNGISQSAAAAMLNVSPRTVATVKAVTKAAPELVERMERGEMTANEAYRHVKFEAAKQQKATPAAVTGKYRVIYADPPWKYNDRLVEGYGPAEYHYPTMTIDELCAMPVKGMAEDNAVLFLWVTSPLLEDSFRIIHAWGFEYKTSFVWDKIKHNMGHYNSVRHEFLLVCTRGSCTPDNLKLYDSVVSIERTEHSVKPAEFRAIIDDIYTSGKKLELFARRPADGWDVWGNDANVN